MDVVSETRAWVTLGEVETARRRVAGFVRTTPLWPRLALGRLAGVEVSLKCENLQRAGSFKVRGALNMIAAQSPQERARTIAAERGFLFVPPFDHLAIVVGQGTLGLELLEQCEAPRDRARAGRRRGPARRGGAGRQGAPPRDAHRRGADGGDAGARRLTRRARARARAAAAHDRRRCGGGGAVSAHARADRPLRRRGGRGLRGGGRARGGVPRRAVADDRRGGPARSASPRCSRGRSSRAGTRSSCSRGATST
ncbi:MAG: pyridoxal-phosphate dependent enzyme [Chloroflexi bacterium]|nr:pyridoxal-phosphate dependent enzyme [Chloroflexota bacterium]